MSEFRVRSYCFTINNPTDDDVDSLLDLSFRYLIFGFEEGEEGTPHIQGYVYFHNAILFSSFHKLLPRAHIEETRGSPTQNRTYCSKEGDFYEFGELPVNGLARWQKIEDAMNNPKENPKVYVQYRRYFKDMCNVEKKTQKTRFYSLKPIFDDSVTEIYQYFDWVNEKVAVVYESLDELEGYDDYDHVIIFTDYPDRAMQNWPRGIPMTYKYGYERKHIYAKTIVLVTEFKLSQLYKKI